eukprot:GEMP01040679.1.p1 GENE.GEMP01040679.1~~GEMP01040679.1.p1  ORF type:complete len:352 (+),score=42.67 GEMP01040679.1:167-1222(+)
MTGGSAGRASDAAPHTQEAELPISKDVTVINDENGKGLLTQNACRYYKIQELGTGNYSKIKLYRDGTGSVVVTKGWLRNAMRNKMVAKFTENGAQFIPLAEQAFKEVRILQRLTQLQKQGAPAHFVLLREVVDAPAYKRMFIVMEYVLPFLHWQESSGAYSARENDDELKVYSCDVALEIAKQVHTAVCYLHDNRIVHNDIKPGNCGLTSAISEEYVIASNAAVSPAGCPPLCVKVFDFSSAAEDLTEDLTVYGAESTSEFMSPESFRSAPTWGPGRDLWAVGLVLFAALFGVSAYRRNDESLIAYEMQVKILQYDWKIPPTGQQRVEKHEALPTLHRLLHKVPNMRKWDN